MDISKKARKKRFHHLIQIYGEELMEEIFNTKVLVVGAGGVGCEVLKNFSMLGVGKIYCVDLDSIDISNLNRQFLFKKQDVGKSKSEVGAEKVRKMNPFCEIISLKKNIITDISPFFLEDNQIDIIVNALDNIEARKHVNRLSLLFNLPLIEGGSTGYLGQASIHSKSNTMISEDTFCYECFEKPKQKVYPVCTIRSEPSSPLHCIQFSKFLFEVLFGDSKNVLSEELSKEEIGISPEKLEKMDTKKAELISEKIFENLFFLDIEKHKNRKSKPIPLSLEKAKKLSPPPSSSSPSPFERSVQNQQREWSVQECAQVFLSSLSSLLLRFSEIGNLSFSKDDEEAVDFVTASSCLRMFNYHIYPRKSRWEVMNIAGSIIPAIATTNAMVAGLQTSNFIHLIKQKILNKKAKKRENSVQNVETSGYLPSPGPRVSWVLKHPTGNKIIRSEKPPAPKPCSACLPEYDSLASFPSTVLPSGPSASLFPPSPSPSHPSSLPSKTQAWKM